MYVACTKWLHDRRSRRANSLWLALNTLEAATNKAKNACPIDDVPIYGSRVLSGGHVSKAHRGPAEKGI
jgi:hypothetical protein